MTTRARTRMVLGMSCLLAAVTVGVAAAQTAEEKVPDASANRNTRNIVLIHGLGANAEIWDAVTPYLKGSLKVRTYELHGHGETRPLPDATIDKEAEALGEFLLESGIVYPTLVGHGMGGMIAMRYTIDHPADVHRLVVIDAAPRQLAGVADKVSVANALLEDYDSFIATRYLDYSSDEEIARDIVDMALRTHEATFISLLMSSFDFDLTEAIARHSVPILVIGSETLFPQDADPRHVLAHLGYGTARNVAFRRIVGAGHYVMLEQPVGTASALLAFVVTRQFD